MKKNASKAVAAGNFDPSKKIKSKLSYIAPTSRKVAKTKYCFFISAGGDNTVVLRYFKVDDTHPEVDNWDNFPEDCMEGMTSMSGLHNLGICDDDANEQKELDVNDEHRIWTGTCAWTNFDSENGGAKSTKIPCSDAQERDIYLTEWC